MDDQPPHSRPRLVVNNGPKPVATPRYAPPPDAVRVRMNAIAALIGVSATTFLDESAARARKAGPAADGPPSTHEMVELHTLFGRVRDPRDRQDCLAFVRAQAGKPSET